VHVQIERGKNKINKIKRTYKKNNKLNVTKNKKNKNVEKLIK